MKGIGIALAALALAGCNTRRMPPVQVFPDMKQQPKALPQSESRFFADGREYRRPVAGTVARGHLNQDTPPAENPLPLTRATLERGQERFNIYCAPCHDRLGTGQGIVAMRAAWPAVNLSEQRVVDMPDAQLYDTITHGKRTMPGYRFQVNEHDRWAIVTYVRALQRASRGTVADVPPELRSDLR
ncbi:MAG TPA: cytochrome c [Bryobacteraceae bacterium]|nr:cytochrome c [Bryobacteraceae bacterium]